MVRQLLLFISVCLALVAPAAPCDEPNLDAIFADMEQRGAAFDARPLHELGVAGLEAVFDRWLPQSRLRETRVPIGNLIRDLTANLGHEDYEVRTAAAQRLILLGDQARSQVVEASRSNDPEVRLQANTILERWKRERSPSLDEQQQERVDNFRNACYAYLQKIDDDERLAVFVRRTKLALEVGLQPYDSRAKLRPCLKGIASLKDDRWCSELLPLLKHDDPQIAVFVVHSIGAARQNDFFPTLLLEALDSDRPEIVEATLSWALNCSDQQRRPQLQQRLRKLLEQPNDALKFQACWPLIHDFQDEAALHHVLTETRGEDVARARTALGWATEAARGRSKPTLQVLEQLAPLLDHDDVLLRRDAAQTLAAFGGEEVLRRLLPLLADEAPAVAQVVTDEFAAAKDRELKQKLLEEVVNCDGDPGLKQAAQTVLKKLK